MVAILSTVLSVAAPALAQDEDALKAFFEGKHVVVMIDMPGTSDGVDIAAADSRLLDSQRYVQRLKTTGTAIHAGEQATVTLVKVKKDHIEFQLGGGGFGTFGDDTSTTVSMAPAPKTGREKELENAVRDETNLRRRRELERELDSLRAARERENRRIDLARFEAEERKRQIVADKRLHGGSRFNLQYEDAVPAVSPQDVMTTLAQYVVFAGFPGVEPRAEEPAPREVSLRKGMSRAETERLLGPSSSVVEHQEGGLRIVTVVFERPADRVTADFVEDVLVRYATSSK